MDFSNPTIPDIPKNQHVYSTGVLLLGPENVHEYIRNVCVVSKLPIISVGSGNGVIERELESAFGIQIICVDPTPLSWSMEHAKYRAPDFATVEDLVSQHPELIDQCNVFINWAFPTHSYDMEAVHLLRPRNVVTITDVGPLRGAGGRFFHTWMSTCGVTTAGTLDTRSLNQTVTYTPYNYVFRTWTPYSSPCGRVELSIIWLSRDIHNPNIESRSTEIANSPLSQAVFKAASAASMTASSSTADVCTSSDSMFRAKLDQRIDKEETRLEKWKTKQQKKEERAMQTKINNVGH